MAQRPDTFDLRHKTLMVLCAFLNASSDGRRLTYRQFASAVETLPADSRRHLNASLFASLPRGDNDTVEVSSVGRFVLMATILELLRTRLSAYDSVGDGCLREHDMEVWIYDDIEHVPQLQALQKNFYPFYVFTAVRRFFFFLDTNKIGKIPIDDLLRSKVLQDWLAVLPPDHPDTAALLDPSSEQVHSIVVDELGYTPSFADSVLSLCHACRWDGVGGGCPPGHGGTSNWFTAHSALRVYSSYLQLDADRNGMLSLDEFSNFKGGVFTSAFVQRVFEESHTYPVPVQRAEGEEEQEARGEQYMREMDYKAYLDLVLATSHRTTAQSLRFMFRLLDMEHQGWIGVPEMRYFFKGVAEKLPALGHEGVNPANVVDEIVDMIGPGRGRGRAGGPIRITLDDLKACKVGHVVCAILTDASAFIAYDRREENLSMNGGEGEGQTGHGSSP